MALHSAIRFRKFQNAEIDEWVRSARVEKYIREVNRIAIPIMQPMPHTNSMKHIIQE